jgi:MFS family permease
MAERYSDPFWPPGTVKLQQLLDNGNTHKNARIILQPRPTEDPNDPLNWPKKQKIINFTLACYYAMMVYAFVNATSPTWGPMGDELGFSSKTLTDTYAIGCATLSLGAPMLIPFALKYGSRPVYVFSSIAQFVISIWAARTMTVGDWWGVNSLQCWFGALAEVLIQMTVADMYFVHQRGLMNTIYIWAYNVGSNLAVVAAGFITDGQSWRWVWWWCAIFFGAQFLMFVFGFEETKFAVPPVIEGQRGGVPETTQDFESKKNEKEAFAAPVTPTSDMEAATSNDEEPGRNLSVAHINPNIQRKTYWQKLSLLQTTAGPWSHFLRHSYQPLMILVSIPGVAFSSLTYAILNAFNTVMTTALSTYMIEPPYDFSASQIGLMSLAPFIGSTLGSIIIGPLSDYIALRLSRRNKGVYEPEFRFYCFLPFIPFQCGGAWYFANALADGRHWSHVAVAYGICNFGSAPLQSLALTYMLDAYNGKSNSCKPISANVADDVLTHLQKLSETLSPRSPSCATYLVPFSSLLCRLGSLQWAFRMFSIPLAPSGYSSCHGLGSSSGKGRCSGTGLRKYTITMLRGSSKRDL